MFRLPEEKGFTAGMEKIGKAVGILEAFTLKRFHEAESFLTDYRRFAGVNPPVKSRNLMLLLLSLCLAGGAYLWASSRPEISQEAALMSGIFVLACMLWATEALPLFATALLAIALEIILLANPGGWRHLGFEGGDSPPFEVFFEPLSDPIIFLFLGGFILAAAAVKRGVDMSMASIILRFFGARPRQVLLGMILITALFSMWMSNTATTAMMVTLVMSLFSQLEGEDRFKRGLLLAIPFAANIGGIGTPIGSPPSAVTVGFLQDRGIPISFGHWMVVTVPIMIALLFFLWWLLWRSYRPADTRKEMVIHAKKTDNKGRYVIFIFVLTVTLWLTETVHGLPTAVVAMLPVVAFTATGLLNREDINSLEWNVLLLIAGGIAIGKGLSETGLDKVVLSWLPTGSAWIVAIIVVITLLLSTFMSNTAATNLLAPIGLSLAFVGGQADQSYAIELAISIALSASLAMSLPVSTPTNTIAYAQGILTNRDFVVNGSVIGAIAIAIILSVLPLIFSALAWVSGLW